MTPRAFVTGIGGQDGSYLAERLLADGIEVHALVLDAEGPPPYCPEQVVLHVGDLGDVEATRRLVLDLAPDEIYNLAAISSVAQSWEEPDLTARVNGSAAVALMESARLVGSDVRLVQASSAEIFGEPAHSPQDEATPIRPVNPYGAAKAFAHLSAGVFRQRDLHVSSAILYNHESPRRPDRFVTRKITSTVAAIARGDADQADARQPRRPPRLGLGAGLRRRDGPRGSGRRRPATTSSRPASATRCATSWPRRSRAPASPTGSRCSRQDPAFVRPADPTELVGDATLARDVLGWAPTVAFEEIVARMVATDLDASRLTRLSRAAAARSR